MSIHCEDGNDSFETLEEKDEHESICQKLLGSEEEWYEFYNKFAYEKGFSVRKGKVKYGGTGHEVVQRQFICFKAGLRQQKYLNMANRQRRHRAVTRCSCPFELVVRLNVETNQWFVKKYNGAHNHEFAKPYEVPFLPSHRNMTELQKNEILRYQNAGLMKHHIMDVMEQQNGGYEKVGFITTDLYNFSQKNKAGKISKGDATAVLQSMSQKQMEDPDFFFHHETDDEDRLVNLFWCDGQSRLDYQAFGDVLIFDSTYRTNRYSMPFVPFVGVNHHRSTTIFACSIVSHETVASFEWLLRTLLMAMYNKEPKSVITDGDHAMRKAIRLVFPNSAHKLCSWHVERNVGRFLHHSVMADFRKLIYMKVTPTEFVLRWKEFMEKHKIVEGNKQYKWVTKMYRIRRWWAASYLKRKFFLGMQSNQRSEGLNSRLHKHLDRTMSLLDMVEHYFHCLKRIRRKEYELDSIASQSVPVAITEHQLLEMDAAKVFTPTNFYLIQKEIGGISKYDIMQVRDDGVSIICSIGIKNGTTSFNVEYDTEGTVDNIKCSCMKFETEGIPCCHIMLVLTTLGTFIPRSRVLSRWTLNAKSSRIGGVEDYLGDSSTKQERFVELVSLARQVFHDLADSPEDCVRWKEMLMDERNKRRRSSGVTGEADCAGQIHQDEETYENVSDAMQMISKGAPCKQIKGFQDVRTRKCGLCGQVGHDRRNCPNKTG